MSDSNDAGGLRARIRQLEQELESAKASRGRGDDGLTSQVASQSEQISSRPPLEAHHESHHVAKNLQAYGRSDKVVFLEPEVFRYDPQECIDEAQTMTGLSGKLARLFIKYKINQFVSRPVLHQWIQDNVVYRLATEQQSSKFELFFDLLFVGIVHQISDAAAEAPNGRGLIKYVLTFCPAHSIWTDVREIVNHFGTDDVTQRLYILWTMVLLVGYSNNASSIELSPSPLEEGSGSLEVTLQSQGTAIGWALGFAAVGKLSKAILVLIYCLFLPHSRTALVAGALINALFALLLLIAIFLPLHGQITLVAVAIVFEYIVKLLGVMFIKILEAAGKKREACSSRSTMSQSQVAVDDDTGKVEGAAASAPESVYGARSNSSNIESTTAGFIEKGIDDWMRENKKFIRFPAINIEHHVDRLGAFVTIILGEMVANIFFKNSIATGLNNEAGRSFLALMLAFNLNWLYFGSEACNSFLHALRRHWMTSAIYTYAHLPLFMSLLLASSAVNKLVVDVDVDVGLKFFFGSGVGIGVLCMCIIGMVHKSLEESRSVLRVSRGHILATRAVAALALTFLPFAHDRLNSIQFLAIYVGVTGFLIAEEIVARLERRPLSLSTPPDPDADVAHV